MGSLGRCAAAGGGLGLAILGSTQMASADVTTPPGVCIGTGTWQSTGKTESSVNHVPSDVIVVPRADTVHWTGSQTGGGADGTGQQRPISGAVELEMPFGTVTIDSWNSNSTRYANQGDKKYNLPSVLAGVKGKLKGSHSENGKTTCSGSVFVQVEGSATSNPLFFASIGGLVISGGLLFFAGKAVFTRV